MVGEGFEVGEIGFAQGVRHGKQGIASWVAIRNGTRYRPAASIANAAAEDLPAAIALTSLTPAVVTPTSTLVIKGR